MASQDENLNSESAQNGHASPVDEAAPVGAGPDAPPSFETQLKEAEAKAREAEAKYLYLYAEFENYKKRTVKERSELVKFGWEGVAVDLIAVLDNLDRALQFAKPDGDKNLLEGLKMVAQQFRSALEKQGVKPITTENQPFNPEIHEAVSQVAHTHPAGSIVEEHARGYLLHGRLLRPSKVSVSTGQN